jgi:hypothetical protein
MEGRIEVMKRRGRTCKHLLEDFKEVRGYWKLEKEALDLSLSRTRFGIGCGPVVIPLAYPGGWFGGFKPPPPKFRSFEKSGPNSHFRGI